ncbi:hypothetical protein QOZ80_7BG0583130 [Eleusine coracana subsp. coracana]|nr:hypothetical protein QOZ80_7BG0583130 [Eleusine coracana subsp. coracana]
MVAADSTRTVHVAGVPVQTTVTARASTARQWLCAENRCLVFQLAQAGAVPDALRRFLADARVTFAGYDADCRKLRAHYGLDVASTMELRRGVVGDDASSSLEEMATKHLGLKGIETMPEKVAMSKWDVATLSKKQVRYACTDAYVSWRLGVHQRGHCGKKGSSREESKDRR